MRHTQLSRQAAHLARGYFGGIEGSHVADCVRRVGDLDVYVHRCGYDYDDERGRDWTVRETVESLCWELLEDDWFKPHDLDEINTLAELAGTYCDVMNADETTVLGVETAEQLEAREREDRRVELEASASKFARKHDIKVNSLEFIAKVNEAIEEVEQQQAHWNSHECRMEQWAAHSYCGSSSAYYDDLNFENERFSARDENLHGILQWLSQECPLLWAKYEEQQLKAK